MPTHIGKLSDRAGITLATIFRIAFALAWYFWPTVSFTLAWSYLFAFAVFLFAFSFQPIFRARPVTNSWLASVTPYVVHGVLGYTIMRWCSAHGFSAELTLATATGTVIAVATVLHYAVEQPTQKLGRRLGALRTPPRINPPEEAVVTPAT